MTANSITNADIIVQAAGLVGMYLPDAAAMAEKETRGRHVWGHDPVDPRGTYVKGAEVTVAAYWNYRHNPATDWQGVGMCQLTAKSWVDEAERLNPTEGAANRLTNCQVGQAGLQRLIKQYGPQDGARRYNGSGSAAEAYGRDFMAKRAAWESRLRGAGAPGPIATAPGYPELVAGATQPADLIRRVQTWLNATFPAYSRIDTGPGVVGPGTMAAVTEYQRRVGIPTDPPFAIGPRTWSSFVSNGFR